MSLETKLQGMPVTTSKDLTLKRIKSQNARIPNLRRLFDHWPQADVHREVDQLRKLVHESLETVYSSKALVAKLDRHDFGLFGACCWPHADDEVSQHLTLMATWLFLWDDEINDSVGPSIAELKKAEILRAKTLQYMDVNLGSEARDRDEQDFPIAALRLFKPVEMAVRRCYPRDAINRLLDEIRFYIETSDVEQARRRDPKLPSQRDYTTARMGSSGVRIFLSFNEYATGIRLPERIMQSVHMKIIWEECNRIVWVMNDVLSLKKELKQDAIDSLVPIIFEQCENLVDSIAGCVEIVERSIELFDDAVDKLLALCEDDVKTERDLQAYIQVARNYCTGILLWSGQTGRYDVKLDVICTDS